MGEQATLRFLDSLGNVQRQDFDILFVQGLDLPYKWNYVPKEAFYKLPDGSIRTNYQGFQRIIEVELAAINQYEDFLRSFFQAPTKSFAYQGVNIIAEECQVTYESPSYEDSWFDEYKQTKKFVFELTENTVRTEWPSPTPLEDNMIGFIIKDIEVVGTLDSPETFETNTGKLVGMVIPPISLLTQRPAIVFDYDQAWMFQRVGDFRQHGDNIQFDLAMAGSGEFATGASTVKARFVLLVQTL